MNAPGVSWPMHNPHMDVLTFGLSCEKRTANITELKCRHKHDKQEKQT